MSSMQTEKEQFNLENLANRKKLSQKTDISQGTGNLSA